MFGLPNRQPRQNGEAETRQPLLEEESHNDRVIFSVADDGEEDYPAHQLDVAQQPEVPKKERTQRTSRSVRFQEDVRIIGPPLRSTIQSREARTLCQTLHHTPEADIVMFSEFELDTDELDDTSIDALETQYPPNSRANGDQRMPLLVGLLDSSAARRSIDTPLSEDGDAFDEHVDLEELAAKQTAGGSMIDSVANMANSILGAGEHNLLPKFKLWYVLI